MLSRFRTQTFSQLHTSGSRLALLLMSTLGLAGLAACSHHPTIEDVAAPLRSEQIIFHVRCEAREQILDDLTKMYGFVNHAALLKRVGELSDLAEKLESRDKELPGEAKLADVLKDPKDKRLLSLMEVAIAYDFDFNITEQNDKSASVGFQMPYTAPAGIDVSGSAAVHLTRVGQRVFKAQEKWSTLMRESKCAGRPTRTPNIAYPVSGEIGMNRLVTTFVSIAAQNVAKDSFVETLIFTTEVGGGLAAGVKLAPVNHTFSFVSAGASVAAVRKDIHKMVVSMVFPQEYKVGKANHSRLDAPFGRPPQWRARYNLCVADARSREDSFKMLRHEPPEVYCITYAEKFVPSIPVAKQSPRPRPTASNGAPKPATPKLYYQNGRFD